MAWAYQTQSSATASSGTLTFSAEPTGSAEGDLLIAFIGYRNTPAFTLPEGWALVATQQSTGNIDATEGIASGVMAYIVRGASAPGLAFTRTGGDVAQGFIFRFTGNATISVYDTGGATTEGAIVTSHTLTGISAAEAGELLVFGYSGGDNTGDTTVWAAATDPTTGWSEIADASTNTGADNTTAVAWAVKANTGTTGDLTCTSVGGSRAALIAGLFKLAPPPNIDLVVADTAHVHTTENITLLGLVYALSRATPAGWLQEVSNTLAHATPRNWMQESVQEAASGDTALVVADAAHVHTVDAPALAAASSLEVADAAHVHTVDAPTLSLVADIALVVADVAHVHTTDAPTLTAASSLEVSDAAHVHAGDTPTLVASSTVEVTDAAHVHAVDAITLSTQTVLSVADTVHEHDSDNVILELLGQANIIVQSAEHAHSADAVTLATDSVLAVGDAAHAHDAEQPELTSTRLLSIDDVIHSHAADNITLTTESNRVLVVADTMHALASDNIDIYLDWLTMQYGFHAVTSSTPTLVAAGVLAKRGSSHATGAARRPQQEFGERASAPASRRPSDVSKRRK